MVTRVSVCGFLFISAGLLAVACASPSAKHSDGGASDSGVPGALSISPATATVVVADNLQANAGTQAFTASVDGHSTSVTWEICALGGAPCYAPGVWNPY